MITVRISERGGVFKEVSVPENSTVQVALQEAGARTDVSKEIRVNNETAELEDMLEANDTIFVVPQTKGNRS